MSLLRLLRSQNKLMTYKSSTQLSGPKATCQYFSVLWMLRMRR